MLFIPLLNNMSGMYRSIAIGRRRHHRGIMPRPLDEHDLPKCSGNPYCLTVDPREFHDIADQTFTKPPPFFTVGRRQGCKLPWVPSTNKLALQLGKEVK